MRCLFMPAGTVRVAASERPAERLFMLRMTCGRGSDYAGSIGSVTVLGTAAQERVGSDVHSLR